MSALPFAEDELPHGLPPARPVSIDLRNVTEVVRASDMSVTIKFTSCHAASRFINALDLLRPAKLTADFEILSVTRGNEP